MLEELTLRDILFAEKRVRPYVRRTPLEISHALSEQTGATVLLKLECWQHTRSFKVRGALNHLLQCSPVELQRGVITASSGNHAQGVAYAAQVVGTDALIVVPENTPRAKLKGTTALGAEIHQEGADYDESETAALRIAKEQNRTFVHAFNDPQVVAGQGTVGFELLLQAESEPDTLLVPVGGGGLIAGIALAAKSLNPSIRVIGVQSRASCPMVRSFHAGELTDVKFSASIADGLYGGITKETLAMVLEFVDDMLVVSEEEICEAISWLLAEERLVVEGAGAVGAAALLSKRVTVGSGDRVNVVISGGNIDYDTLRPLLHD